MTKSKPRSTYDELMSDPEFKRSFEMEYRELLLSELMHAMMAEDQASVRELAREVGISATTIQNLRSGKQNDIRLNNFMGIAEACGYHLVLEKNHSRIPLNPA